MANRFADHDLESLRDLSAKLERSAKFSTPLFLIGIFAALIGAIVAIYFIVNLSNDLRSAELELKQTQAALAISERNSEEISERLENLRSESHNVEEDESINAAISEVQNIQRDLAEAAVLVNRADQRIARQEPSQFESVSGDWIDRYGTIYTISQSGSSFSYTANFRQNIGNGEPLVGRASGTFADGRARYEYTDNGRRRLQCTATFTRDRQRMDETCVMPDGQEELVTLIRA